MNRSLLAALLATALALPACAREPAPSAQPRAADPHAAHAPAAKAKAASGKAVPVAAGTLPRAIVHKSPTCGCCEVWVEHLKQNGFRVEVRNEDNLNPIKERLGVPYGKGSCHTAQIGGYIVEGHVPASDIKRLLKEKPDARGLVLPGMPIGSPGMEVPGVAAKPYTVELVKRDGSTVGYSTHGK
ncbi:DUF411 domain-containing protein [Lysobacter solisilvae (ex Woo and Kim 2020)]|uniref:DUF411 domain-containing protein n=1 Tax=Agrilutibacter terrestris TaxID=2865112 RepID=A0A7H0G1E3_9GAMM|nr:DUF411 domain-containing protein [Lysobacter terrestris]QNP42109.1 DUF411 domain-containing protein [Lysobacter terrestris]